VIKRICLALLLCLGSIVTAAAGSTPADALHALFSRYWEAQLARNPESASRLGDDRYNGRWSDLSPSAIRASYDELRRFRAELATIDRDALTGPDQLNYDLFDRRLAETLDAEPFQPWLLPLQQRNGPHTAHLIAERLRFDSARDYEDWIARLEAFPTLIEQTLALMQEGVRQNILWARAPLERISAQLAAHLVDDPTTSPFYSPFLTMSNTIPMERAMVLQARASSAIATGVVPALRALQRYFEEEYLPASYDAAGIWQQSGGRDYYRYLTRRFTTTDMSPEAIHERGLAEVARIRAAMEDIRAQIGFTGTLPEFFDHLRMDPRYFYDSPEALLEGYRAISKRIDPEIVRVFRTLPRMPYGVVPIPAEIAPDTTTAYYARPAADGSRAGLYYVNLYKPETRPRWEMMALSIHEAVPGHHLQLALQQELGDMPAFRRYGGFTAFTEGWGLYSESLGDELGLYNDPLDKFGQLTYEMWRAVRLVVDTGMHFFEWDRQRAIDYFLANAPKTEQDVVNEIDRYITNPGQALAYKIGELKLQELRARAQQALGEHFNLGAFHDAVLLAGALPLDLLEQRVDAWIAAGGP